MKKSTIKPLEKQLGYTFTDKQLLMTALTHKTYAFEAQTPQIIGELMGRVR